MKQTGIDLIVNARDEQINKHHFTIEHDVKTNKQFELQDFAVYAITGNEDYVPKGWEYYKKRLEKKSRIDQLAHAGAVLAAEIDRLQNKLNGGK